MVLVWFGACKYVPKVRNLHTREQGPIELRFFPFFCASLDLVIGQQYNPQVTAAFDKTNRANPIVSAYYIVHC